MKHITDIKYKNKKDIIRLLYKKSNMSKKRAALELSLSPSVMTKLCNELLAEGIIVEKKPLKTGKAGRKEIEIAINPSYRKCFGIVMNHRTTTILLTDMYLNILSEKSFPTNPNPEKHLNLTINSLKEIISVNNFTTTDILGIGISIKGNTDGIFAYYGIWDKTVDIKNRLEDELGIPVALDNGIRCSAMLQQLYSAEDNFIFIKYMEPGIGGAVIENGVIKRGETHALLDFGHIIIRPDGEYCPICKRRGCLESLISIESILAYAAENFSPDFSPALYHLCDGAKENLSIEKIIQAVEDGCIEMNKLFKRNASYFAMCLINTYALTDIKKIIIIGDLFYSGRFLSYLKSAIYDYQLTSFYENIEIHEHENVLLSSVVLALNAFLF